MNNRKTVGNINTELIFKYFNRKTTEEEVKMLGDWIDESEEHGRMYVNARALYEAYLMQAPIDVLEGHPSVPVRKPSFLRNIAVAVSGVAAAVAIFLCALYITDVRYEERLADTMNTIVVPAGKSMDYILSDGTVIRLNSGAILQYPVAFAKDCREVHLDGEAYFDVVHNESRPFIVKTFASEIKVLGTEFNVNADKESGIFSATLIEGSICLYNALRPGENIVMRPNEKVTLVNERMVLESKNVSKDIRWLDGVIDIGGLDFEELMKKLEKAFGVKIIVECAVMPELEYTSGELRISDGIDNALRVIRNGAEFTYRKDTRTGTIYIR